MQPKVYLRYSRKKPCSLTALFYIEKEIDLYGWYIAAGHHAGSHAFFMVENFYTASTPVLYRSLADDVYAPWTVDFPPASGHIRSPIPADIGHELERMQSRFIEEWLFFETDPDIGAEVAAYHSHSLPVQLANIRYRKMHHVDPGCDEWVHITSGADFNVAEFLEKNWRAEPACQKEMPDQRNLL